MKKWLLMLLLSASIFTVNSQELPTYVKIDRTGCSWCYNLSMYNLYPPKVYVLEISLDGVNWDYFVIAVRPSQYKIKEENIGINSNIHSQSYFRVKIYKNTEEYNLLHPDAKFW